MTENTEHHDDEAAPQTANNSTQNEAPQQKVRDGEPVVEQLNAAERYADALLADDDQEIDDQEADEAEGFSDPMEALAADCHKLETENAQLKDRILRSAAEMENLRRRTTKDVADARAFSIAGFARDMLAVSDNLRRTIETLGEDDKELESVKIFLEGIEMTEREMLNGLEKNGVKKIVPLDEKFDPNFHQAMFELPNPDIPNNTIVQVVQDGYVIGNRVLRPAMVGVAKGGPKFVAPKENAEADNSET
ncbi:MAG: nucleotide exchange factor GrpE [Rhizobiaceae bacterium]|nr:nucleotide exchange factor GrpE [Rhizobiaceae bacterium]